MSTAKNKFIKKWQPIDEKEAERQLIRDYAEKKGCTVIKLQDDADDGKTDGIIEYKGKHVSVEVRRKGYPNHKGRDCEFKRGWETEFLVNEGIILNEQTIRNHQLSKRFIYIVEIKGPKGPESRVCRVNKARISELLNQPFKQMRSTNSDHWQSVKYFPVSWFEPY